MSLFASKKGESLKTIIQLTELLTNVLLEFIFAFLLVWVKKCTVWSIMKMSKPRSEGKKKSKEL